MMVNRFKFTVQGHFSDKNELFRVTFKDIIMDFKCCEDNEMKLLEVIKIDTMIKPRL